MKKRAQITVFIIIGIILVIIATFSFYLLYDDKTPAQSNIKPLFETDSIKMFVQDCVEISTEKALIFLGKQGGYLSEPEQKIETGDTFLAYDYYEGENLLPDQKEIEKGISKYITRNLYQCINDLQANFDNYDYEFGEISVDTSIKDTYVMVNVNYPITIKSLDGATKINEFGTKVPIRLSYMLDTVNKTIEASRDEPNWVNFGLLSSFDLTINMLYYGDDVVYVFEDPKSKISNQNFTFVFAIKLADDFPPELFPFDDYEVKAGEEIRIKSKAMDFGDDKITYSGMDAIDKDMGVIRFMASIQGIYTFTIRATDSKGNYDEEKLTIKVI